MTPMQSIVHTISGNRAAKDTDSMKKCTPNENTASAVRAFVRSDKPLTRRELSYAANVNYISCERDIEVLLGEGLIRCVGKVSTPSKGRAFAWEWVR